MEYLDLDHFYNFCCRIGLVLYFHRAVLYFFFPSEEKRIAAERKVRDRAEEEEEKSRAEALRRMQEERVREQGILREMQIQMEEDKVSVFDD